MLRTLPWIAVSLLAACSSDSSAATAGSDILKRPLGLERAELITDAANPLTAAKAELGKQLFFDARLSGTGKMACAACHEPERAFTDGKARSIRDSGVENSFNSPQMYNVGYYERLYWDGRAKGLENNVKAAWTAQIDGKPAEVVARLEGVAEYQKAFQAAFGEGPSETTIVNALASFLRSLRSGDSAFDRWKAGQKDAIGEQAKKGYELFLSKAACIVCHMEPLFSDGKFHNIGVGMDRQPPPAGAASEKSLNDPTLTGAFKTPSLRNVARTAPYFHDGHAATLREAVAYMAAGGTENPHRDPLLLPKKLSDEEIDQLVAFLETLDGNHDWTPPNVPK